MITTLRTGALTLSAVAKYKFSAADKKLIIQLSSTAHKLYGGVNITLSHAQVIGIHNIKGELIENYFNKTFKFIRTDANTLEYSEIIQDGITIAENFQNLPTDGTPIAAIVANSSFDLPAGRHSFFLLDTADSEFSTSTISIKQLNIGGSGVDGIESVFDDVGADPLFSINNQDIYFSYPARISIKDDNSGVTNIPLVINS